MPRLDALLARGASGVYWLEGQATPAALRRAAADAGRALVRASLGAARGKAALLDRLAAALALPDWFGRNWDALEEALGEAGPGGLVLLLDGVDGLARGAPADLRALLGVLRAAARSRRGGPSPLLALLRGEGRPPGVAAADLRARRGAAAPRRARPAPRGSAPGRGGRSGRRA